jgi:hypothetical protein
MATSKKGARRGKLSLRKQTVKDLAPKGARRVKGGTLLKCSEVTANWVCDFPVRK